MRKRFKVGKRRSKRMFTKHAVRTHTRTRPRSNAMRGGIRLECPVSTRSLDINPLAENGSLKLIISMLSL